MVKKSFENKTKYNLRAIKSCSPIDDTTQNNIPVTQYKLHCVTNPMVDGT